MYVITADNSSVQTLPFIEYLNVDKMLDAEKYFPRAMVWNTKFWSDVIVTDHFL